MSLTNFIKINLSITLLSTFWLNELEGQRAMTSAQFWSRQNEELTEVRSVDSVVSVWTIHWPYTCTCMHGKSDSESVNDWFDKRQNSLCLVAVNWTHGHLSLFIPTYLISSFIQASLWPLEKCTQHHRSIPVQWNQNICRSPSVYTCPISHIRTRVPDVDWAIC